MTRPRLLSKHEAAAQLGISWQTLFRLRDAGKIGCVRIGTTSNHQVCKFEQDEIDRFARSHRVPASAPDPDTCTVELEAGEAHPFR